MSPRRILVVANQTLGGEQLFQAIERHVAYGPSAFHVVVPATIPSEGWVYTESAVHVQAQGRLMALLDKLAQVGVSATGSVGDTNPMYAIEDALRTGHFDALLISTLPLNVSKWLRQDLPSRAARRFKLPVEHVISDPPNETPAEPSKKERGRHERQTA